jgi:hypothetical protein
MATRLMLFDDISGGDRDVTDWNHLRDPGHLKVLGSKFEYKSLKYC